jgi:hypothetical protein
VTWSSLIIIILLALLAACGYYLIKFSLIILQMQDAFEEMLDVLDERYRSISKVLEIPLFYDSPQIRQVVNDIKVTRDTVLLVANRFASIDSTAVEEEGSPQ